MHVSSWVYSKGCQQRANNVYDARLFYINNSPSSNSLGYRRLSNAELLWPNTDKCVEINPPLWNKPDKFTHNSHLVHEIHGIPFGIRCLRICARKTAFTKIISNGLEKTRQQIQIEILNVVWSHSQVTVNLWFSMLHFKPHHKYLQISAFLPPILA